MDEPDHLSLGYKNLDGAQKEEDTDPVTTTSTRPMKRACNNKKLGWALQRTRSDSSVKVSSNGASKTSNHYHRPPRPPQTIVTALASNSKVADSTALNRSQSFTDNGGKVASIVTPSGDTRHCKGAFQFYKKKLGQAFSSSSSSLSSIASSSGTKVKVRITETPQLFPPAVLVTLPSPPSSASASASPLSSPKRKSRRSSGRISPVSTASLSPKLFQKSDRTCNVPAALILGPDFRKTPPTSRKEDGPNPEPSSRLHSGGNLVSRKKFEFLNSPTPSKAPTSSNATEPPVRPPRRHNSPKSSKQITDQTTSEEASVKMHEIGSAPCSVTSSEGITGGGGGGGGGGIGTKERLKLEEVLEMCADYERQIEAEQKQGLLMRRQIEQQRLRQNSVDSTPPPQISHLRLPMVHTHQQVSSTSVLTSPTAYSSTSTLVPQSHQKVSPVSPHHSPWSPGALTPTLAATTPNRIITNGSLPREGKLRHASPAASLSLNCSAAAALPSTPPPSAGSPFLPASEADLRSIFGFENPLPMPALDSSPALSSATLTNGSHQGGGEGLYGSQPAPTLPKRKPNTAGPLSPTLSAGGPNSPLTSPGSTVHRRPPRSKHDPARAAPSPNCQQPTKPSQEAHSRLLIGTTMLLSPSSNGHNSTSPGVQNDNHLNGGSKSQGVNANLNDLFAFERLQVERREQLERLTGLKQRLNQLESTENEEIGEMDLERSLLAGELESENDKVRKIKSRLSLLRIQEQRLSGVFGEWQKIAADKMNLAQVRIKNAEKQVKTLESKVSSLSSGNDESSEMTDPDSLAALMESLKYQQEVVELERKTFEDMEFHQMEEEVHKQTEREELLKEIGDLERESKRHERQLEDLEAQQKQILETVRRDTARLESQRQQVISQLAVERSRLESIESKISCMAMTCSSSGAGGGMLGDGGEGGGGALLLSDPGSFSSPHDNDKEAEDSGSDDNNCELEANLRRLELLDKTQDQVEQLTQAVTKLKSETKGNLRNNNINRPTLDNNKNPFTPPTQPSTGRFKGCSPLLVLQQQKQIAEELNKVIKAMNGSTSVSSLPNNNNTGSNYGKMVSTKHLMVAAAPTNQNHSAVAADSLNSAGSEEGSVCTTGSTSDLHTESLSTSNEFMSKGTPSPIQRADKLRNGGGGGEVDPKRLGEVGERSSSLRLTPPGCGTPDSRKDPAAASCVGGDASSNEDEAGVGGGTLASSSICMSDLTSAEECSVVSLMDHTSRPMSEASSVWDEAESQLEVKRRQNLLLKQQRPLTRYLPIRGDACLDLRSHIETAGHHLEMIFPAVVIDSLTCRGYLHKLGSSAGNPATSSPRSLTARLSGSKLTKPGRSSWNKRWFVFDRTKKTLVYYADKSESKAKGGVYFSAIEEVYVDHLNAVKSPNPKVTFVMKTFERTYYLMAPSPEAMRVWVDVIFTGAEGYQEFQ